MLRLSHVIAATVAGAMALVACRTGENSSGRGAPAASQSAALAASAVAPGKPAVVNKWGKEVGFKAPESVLHDTQNDLYLVSNVDGDPAAADGNGFISKVAPIGQGVTLKWIEGGKNKVTLNAPKGMALVGGTLWVADIDTVRLFDRSTGAPLGEVKVPGAAFLNDVAVAADGRILVSDTGTEKVRSEAVYAIDQDRKVTTIAKGAALGGPNGLVALGDNRMYVVATNGELYSLDPKGVKANAQTLPGRILDGIVLGRGDYFVSSWEAKAVYRGRPGSPWEVSIEDVKSPADLTYDKQRNRVIVPLMEEDEVRAYEIK